MKKNKQNNQLTGQRIWAIGGGKGGVGKSLIAANFAIILASLGKNVVAVDLDLGNANMHTCLGIRYPQKTLIDFLRGDIKNLNDILLDTSIYNLKFISGSGGIVGSANPWYAQKLKILRCLEKLQVDHIVLDLSAGTSYNTIDFFLSATDHIIITSPETTSIQSAFNFIRISLFRKLQNIFHDNTKVWKVIENVLLPYPDKEIQLLNKLMETIKKLSPDSYAEIEKFLQEFHPKLIMNMVIKKDEVKLGWGLKEVIKRYLDINVDYVGSISYDKIIRESLSTELPFIIKAPNSRPTNELFAIIPKILENHSDGNIKEIVQRGVARANETYSNRIVESNNMAVDPSIYVIDRVKAFEPSRDKESIGFFNIKTTPWSKIAIDIGTSNTLIFIKGHGIVLNEPSLMSIDENNGKIVAMGHEAKAMLGRSHSGIKIVAPMESGAISDYTDVKKMIQEFIKNAKSSTILIRPVVVLTIPMMLTSLEIKAVQEFINELGARETHLVYEPFAAAVGTGLPVDVPRASMLVNIGGGSISAVVISLSGIVSYAAERKGSKTLDNTIVRYLRENHNFNIGDQTAELVKINYGQAMKTGRDKKFILRGQNLENRIPQTLSISTAEIREAIKKPVYEMVKVILTLLENVPPELSGDLVERGMTLTGGGAVLKGFDQYIKEQTGIKVRISPNAQTAAVIGAGRMLDDFKLYNKFFVNNIKNHTLKG